MCLSKRLDNPPVTQFYKELSEVSFAVEIHIKHELKKCVIDSDTSDESEDDAVIEDNNTLPQINMKKYISILNNVVEDLSIHNNEENIIKVYCERILQSFYC